jgi:hypothetical protein
MSSCFKLLARPPPFPQPPSPPRPPHPALDCTAGRPPGAGRNTTVPPTATRISSRSSPTRPWKGCHRHPRPPLSIPTEGGKPPQAATTTPASPPRARPARPCHPQVRPPSSTASCPATASAQARPAQAKPRSGPHRRRQPQRPDRRAQGSSSAPTSSTTPAPPPAPAAMDARSESRWHGLPNPVSSPSRPEEKRVLPPPAPRGLCPTEHTGDGRGGGGWGCGGGWPGFAPPPVSPRGGSDAGAGLIEIPVSY